MERSALLSGLTLVLAFATHPAPVMASDASDAAKADAARQREQIGLCYAVSAIGSSTVRLRNEGKTLDEQLASRKQSVPEAQYPLVEDITRQVYDKDLRDHLVVASDSHRACLQAQGNDKRYSASAQQLCPRLGVMRSEVDALRRAGKSPEDVIALLKDTYAGVRGPLGEDLAGMAAATPKGDQPDTGAFDHELCMIVGMQY